MMSSRIPGRPNSTPSQTSGSPLEDSPYYDRGLYDGNRSTGSAQLRSSGQIATRTRHEGDVEKVKVFARIRPALREDETPGALVWSEEGGHLTIFRPEAPVPQSDFVFDRVLGPGCSQADVYTSAVSDVVADVLRGYNGTILAYGQTGAGKTYTLGNTTPDAIGMVPRAAAELFSAAARDPSHLYRITMSYIQIYMEMIQDLLNPTADNLPIREDANGVFVAGACEVPVASLEECLHYLELGEQNRVFAFTHLNAHSSRSHAVVMLTVIKSRKYLTNEERAQAEAPDQDGVVTQKVTVGKLYMVDLAGSERLKKSKSVGLRATEARSINLSLTMLGMCISARAQDSPHVPFRDSKLTRLLQESLGGNAKTSLILCLSDVRQHADESHQSLQFGARAACVRNKPVVNERLQMRQLTAELLAALEEGHERVDGLEAALTQTKEERDALQAALAREKARSAAIAEALRAEARAKDEQAAARLAEQAALLSTHVQQLGAVQQVQGQLESQVAKMKAEAAAREEAHAAQLAELQQRLNELKAAATAASERASLEAQARSQLAASAQQQTAALSNRLAREREAARDQAAAVRSALARLHQALSELLTGTNAPGAESPNSEGEGAGGKPPPADSVGAMDRKQLAAAAAAAAASRRSLTSTSHRSSATGTRGSSSGGAVQLIQEALGLAAAADGDGGDTTKGLRDEAEGADAEGESKGLVARLQQIYDPKERRRSGSGSSGGGAPGGLPRRSRDQPQQQQQQQQPPEPAERHRSASERYRSSRDGGGATDRRAPLPPPLLTVNSGIDLTVDDADLLSTDGVVRRRTASPSSPSARSAPPTTTGRGCAAILRKGGATSPDIPGRNSRSSPGRRPQTSSQRNMKVHGDAPTSHSGSPPRMQPQQLKPHSHRRLNASPPGLTAPKNSGAVVFGNPASPGAPMSPHGYILGEESSATSLSLPFGYGPPVQSTYTISLATIVANDQQRPAGPEQPSSCLDGLGNSEPYDMLHATESVPRIGMLNVNPAFDTIDSADPPAAAVAVAAAAVAGAATDGDHGGAVPAGSLPRAASPSIAAATPAAGNPGLQSPGTSPPARLPSIQSQLDALWQLAGALKRMKAELLARLTKQAAELAELQGQNQQSQGQLETTRSSLTNAEVRLAKTAAELHALRTLLDDTVSELGTTRQELAARCAALEATRGSLGESADRVGELQAELDASREESRRLGQELERTQVDLAAERSALRGLLAASERATNATGEALAKRHQLARQIRAANTIKRVFKRWKVAQLRAQAAADQMALQDYEASQRQRDVAQGSRAGQALVQESVAAMRDAVSSILATFLGRQSELAASRALRCRLEQLLPSASPSQPHSPRSQGGALAPRMGPGARGFSSAGGAGWGASSGGGGAMSPTLPLGVPMRPRAVPLSMMLSAVMLPRTATSTPRATVGGALPLVPGTSGEQDEASVATG